MQRDFALHRLFSGDVLEGLEKKKRRSVQPRNGVEQTRLAMLYELTRKLHQSLDLDRVLQQVLASTIEITGAHIACVILLDEQGMPAYWVGSDGLPRLTDIQVAAALYQGDQGAALSYGQALRFQDWAEPTGTNGIRAHLLPGRSFLVVPLATEEQIIGVLTLAHAKPQAFTTDHEEVLNEAAATIGLAIHHARLHTQVKAMAHAYEHGKYQLVHDLRSPLAAVSASIEVIKRALTLQATNPDDVSLPGLMQESAEAGQRSLRQVIDLISNLLDTRKLQITRHMIDYESVGLELLYDEICTMLRNLATERHVMLRYQVTPRALHVPGDPTFLRRLLTNLIANALRFTPEGGMIWVKASTDERTVLLAVEDTGPGVDPQNRERIFQPFVQGQGEERRGTGLGLAICRDIAHAHGGRIWVEERQGGGSRFCVELPAQVAEQGGRSS